MPYQSSKTWPFSSSGQYLPNKEDSSLIKEAKQLYQSSLYSVNLMLTSTGLSSKEIKDLIETWN